MIGAIESRYVLWIMFSQELGNFNQNLWTIFLDTYLNGIRSFELKLSTFDCTFHYFSEKSIYFWSLRDFCLHQFCMVDSWSNLLLLWYHQQTWFHQKIQNSRWNKRTSGCKKIQKINCHSVCKPNSSFVSNSSPR